MCPIFLVGLLLIQPNLQPRWCFVTVISKSWKMHILFDAYFIWSSFGIWDFVGWIWPLLSLNSLLSLCEVMKWRMPCQSVGSPSLFSFPTSWKALLIPESFEYPLVLLVWGVVLIPFENSRSCSKLFPTAYWYSDDRTFGELFFLLLHTA